MSYIFLDDLSKKYLDLFPKLTKYLIWDFVALPENLNLANETQTLQHYSHVNVKHISYT